MVTALLATFKIWRRLRGTGRRVRLGGWLIAYPLVIVAGGALLLSPPGPADYQKTWPLPDAMKPDQTLAFPARVVPARQVVEADSGLTVQVTGPPELGPPAGSHGWLRHFDMVTLPVKAGYLGDAPGRSERERRFDEEHYTEVGHGWQIMLLGVGRGTTRTVRTPPCDAGLKPFENIPTAAVTRPLCFLVPPGFEPHYLVVDTGIDTRTPGGTTVETTETAHLDDVAITLLSPSRPRPSRP